MKYLMAHFYSILWMFGKVNGTQVPYYLDVKHLIYQLQIEKKDIDNDLKMCYTIPESEV